HLADARLQAPLARARPPAPAPARQPRRATGPQADTRQGLTVSGDDFRSVCWQTSPLTRSSRRTQADVLQEVTVVLQHMAKASVCTPSRSHSPRRLRSRSLTRSMSAPT